MEEPRILSLLLGKRIEAEQQVAELERRIGRARELIKQQREGEPHCDVCGDAAFGWLARALMKILAPKQEE